MYSSGALSLTSAERIIPVLNRVRGPLGWAVVAGLVLGCGGDSTSPPSRTGLQIDAGANVTDTVSAVLTQALIVEVRKPNGSLVSGAVARFTALSNDSEPYASAIAVANLNSQNFSNFASDSTDAHGHAAVLVELGSVTGKAGILITVPELGLTDTAHYTVTPGRPAHFALSIRDTVVSKGATWDIGVHVTDRYGNQLSTDSVTFTSLNDGATVTASGHVTATSEGRAEIEVRSSGTTRDTSRASVVPAGTLVGVRPNSGVYLMNFDGSGLKTLTVSSDYSLFPQWSPDRTRITIYEGNPYGETRLTALALDGTRTPVIPTPGAQLGGAAWMRPDVNGLLYFSGPRSDTHNMAIWRMNADGSGLVKLGDPANTYDFTHPAPSPDGKTVLYDVDPQGIMAIDVATSSVHSLGLRGSFPSYSPDGARIAYLSGSTLMVANSDGTGARMLWGSATIDVSAPSWSTDGKWILAPQGGGGAAIVRVSDAEVLPLPFAFGYFQLAIR
jgi:hypothetical protein